MTRYFAQLKCVSRAILDILFIIILPPSFRLLSSSFFFLVFLLVITSYIDLGIHSFTFLAPPHLQCHSFPILYPFPVLFHSL